MTKYLIGILFFLTSVLNLHAESTDGLIVHAGEMGIGKFHRKDNQVHPHSPDNIWKNFILSEKAEKQSPVVQDNQDGSVTIFFSTLEELLSKMIDLSKERNKKISVLNIEAHGLPGAMWFPADEDLLRSPACADWVKAANGPDDANYDQYYSPVSASEIYTLRILSYISVFHAPCTTGVREWRRVASKFPDLKTIFASDAQLHLFSCVVGYGPAGRKLVRTIGPLLFPEGHAKVEASMNFGLGDWSMPEGMGFWDFLNRTQLKGDNQKYPVDRQDREIMQKGKIRLAEFINGKWQNGILKNLDFMYGNQDSYSLEGGKNLIESENLAQEAASRVELMRNIRFPLRARIPGTAAYVQVW